MLMKNCQMPKKISATQPGSILSSQWETVAFLTCPSPPQPLCRFRWSLLDDGSRPTLRGGTGAHLPPSRSSRRKRSQKRSQKMKSSSWRSTPCSGHLTQKTGRYQMKTENNFTQKNGSASISELNVMQEMLSTHLIVHVSLNFGLVQDLWWVTLCW